METDGNGEHAGRVPLLLRPLPSDAADVSAWASADVDGVTVFGLFDPAEGPAGSPAATAVIVAVNPTVELGDVQPPTALERGVRSAEGVVLHATLANPDGASLTLLAADGRPLTDAYVGSSDGEKSFDWVLAPASTYLLVVTTDNHPSPYSLSVGIDESVALVDGRAQGELRRPDQVAAFRIDDRPGNVLSVLVSPLGSSTRWSKSSNPVVPR